MRSKPSALRVRTVAALVVALAMALAAAPGPAAAAPPDFPAKSEVKQILGGAGGWTSFRAEPGALGARPAGCRSDLQFLDPTKAKVRVYNGREAGLPRSILSGASVFVYRYASVDAARAAVENNASYPVRCPRVVEWVCEDCDGISTTRRTLVPARLTGEQSVAWRFREVGNLKSSGHTIVARQGSTVVQASVTRTRDFVGNQLTYPEPPRKRAAVQLARAALAAAG